MRTVGQIDLNESDVALRSAPALSASPLHKALQALRQLGRAVLLNELAEAGAWIDATVQ
jgi:hypothetical protein